jgi:prostaglandin-H2 D-isomerase / glutathione transferase
MTKPKLTYFDMSASRGEECRLAFALSGTDFEDHRIARDAWAALKPTTPFGSLPILEVANHRIIAQSNAILVYIGRTYGGHPTDVVDAACHEAVLAHVEDLRAAVGPSGRLTDDAAKRAARAELAATAIPTWANHVEKQIGNGPFFSGEKAHVVDIKLYMGMRGFRRGVMDHIPPTVFDAFPKLVRLYDAVEQHPALKAWMSRHA